MDLVTFIFLPGLAVIAYKTCESSYNSSPKRPKIVRQAPIRNAEGMRSQVIRFSNVSSQSANSRISKRAPGTLVRVRLLNTVETRSVTPVHVRIIDGSLGNQFLGGVLIGEALPDADSGRIRIDFRIARPANGVGTAATIVARALSLDGTYGLDAKKKEGFFARAVLRAPTGSIESKSDNQDIKSLITRALASGLLQETQSLTTGAASRGQSLVLEPSTEFLVELTDFFPG